MKRLLLLPLLLLAACVGLPEQKIGDGQAGCVSVSSVYGSASSVVTRADNTPKGSSSQGKLRVTCGSAVMEIENVISAPPPPPANPATGRAGTPPAQ